MGREPEEAISGAVPLLTILIPTYNRAERARALVSHLLPFVESMDGVVELIVSINSDANARSEPSDTERYLEQFSSRFLQVVAQPSHFPTAEQHIYTSLRVSRGEYVLFHGDDDLSVVTTLQSLIPMLKHGRYDFIAFSSTMIDIDGGDIGGPVPRMNTDIVEIDFLPGALSLGFMFGLAGFANIVQRRNLLASIDQRQIFENEPIYAHVAWRLEAFRGGLMAIVNRPLVYFRVDESDAVGAHFRELAAKRMVGDFHFWGLGIIRHLSYLERKGILRSQDISAAFDFRRDGTHFRLLDNIIRAIQAQTLLATKSGDVRNDVSGEDLQFMTDWLLHIEPAYYEPIQIIHDIHAQRVVAAKGALPRIHVESRYSKQIKENDLQKKADLLNDVFNRVMEHRASTNKYVGLVSRYRSYSIYRHMRGLVAFDDGRRYDCQNYLRIIDPKPEDDGILVLSFTGSPCSDLDIHLVKVHQMIDHARTEQAKDRRSHNWPQLDELANVFKENALALRATTLEVRAVAQDAHFLTAVLKLERETSPDRWWRRSLTGFSYDYYRRTYGVEWFPLKHFLRRGWREGNNPSAAFDTVGYLSRNPDVAAADVNPLLHFLSHGRQERRQGWY